MDCVDCDVGAGVCVEGGVFIGVVIMCVVDVGVVGGGGWIEYDVVVVGVVGCGDDVECCFCDVVGFDVVVV